MKFLVKLKWNPSIGIPKEAPVFNALDKADEYNRYAIKARVVHSGAKGKT